MKIRIVKSILKLISIVLMIQRLRIGIQFCIRIILLVMALLFNNNNNCINCAIIVL